MTATKLTNFINSISVDELQNYYFSHTEEEFRQNYNLSYGNLRVVKKEFNLYLTKDQINQKRKETWNKKPTSKFNKQEQLVHSISKNTLVEFYINQNHSFDETLKNFNLINDDLLFLLNYYDCKKDKHLSHKIAQETCTQKYGDANYNNSEKRISTCLEKYGVSNTFQSSELMKDVYMIKTSKYGDGNANNWKKNHITRIQNSGTLEDSYKKQAETYKQTCLDKYGIDCTLNLPEARSNIKTKDSKPNLQFKTLLESNNIIIDDNKDREFKLNSKSFDFKINNILVEINPTITHNSTFSPFGNPLSKTYHSDKSTLARQNGYRCIHVWDWDDQNKIVNLLIPHAKLYARNCELKHVAKIEAAQFINTYHFQNYAKDEIRLGLYYNDELVSIMTFGKPRYNKKYDYEIIRYCSSCNIVGGAEKLFKHFLEEYNPNSIISYCDLSKFTGNTYLKLGFKYNKTTIGCHWYNIKTGQHITDNLLRQRGFDQLFNTNYGKGTSNKQLMLNAGFVEVYDAGQASYIYKMTDN